MLLLSGHSLAQTVQTTNGISWLAKLILTWRLSPPIFRLVHWLKLPRADGASAFHSCELTVTKKTWLTPLFGRLKPWDSVQTKSREVKISNKIKSQRVYKFSIGNVLEVIIASSDVRARRLIRGRHEHYVQVKISQVGFLIVGAV